MVEKDEKKIFPDVPAEIPGVPLREEINSGAQPTDFQDAMPSLQDRMKRAVENANLADMCHED